MAFGFPSKKDMAEMFGYVTPEDQAKWEKQREARKQAAPGTAQEMAAKSIAPALDLAKHGIRAQMHGAQTEAQRGAQPKQRVKTVKITETEQSRNIDASDDDYMPGF
jgi:hypothetical protein